MQLGREHRIMLKPCFVHSAQLLASPQAVRCIEQGQAGDCEP